MFPRLKSLSLWRLQRLKYFYSEIHTLECPVLEDFIVQECEKLKIFSWEPQDLQGVEKLELESPQISEVAQPLFSFRKVRALTITKSSPLLSIRKDEGTV